MHVIDSLRTLAIGVAVAALLVLSTGGVEVRAEPVSPDAVPTASQLFSIEAASHGGSVETMSCGAAQARIDDHRRRMALAELAAKLEQVGEDPQGWKPLNGRGYNYLRRPDPSARMARIHAEAERQRAAAE